MRKLKDLSLAQRPRELLLKKGATALSVADLWSVFIGSGNAKTEVRKISSSLAAFGEEVASMQLERFLEVPGIGLNRALAIVAVREIFNRFDTDKSHSSLRIVSSSLAAQIFMKIAKKKREYILAAYLDAYKRLIKYTTVSIGTLNSSIIHPRDVFSEAISQNAAYVILGHNHPSGLIIPSREDLKITRDLVAAGKLLGIPLIDHIILASNSWRSIVNGKSGEIF